MREAPPFSPTQAFEEDQRARSAAGRAALGLNGNGIHQLAAGASPLHLTDPISLHGKPVPPRNWIVPGIIPDRQVTGLYGPGGGGKSLLAMQMGVAAALGRDWLGQPVKRCKVLGFFCEDDSDELHRRMADILVFYDAAFNDIGDFHWQSRAGMESDLMTFPYDRGKRPEPTELHGQIKRAAKSFGAKLVILDSLHDIFAGNENDRGHARKFVRSLHNIALEIDGAVLFLAHPSLSGQNSGSGTSGSTGWDASVRSRLFLTRPGKDGDMMPDSDSRVLRFMKNNYGPAGNLIEIAWRDGVFVERVAPTGIFKTIEAGRIRTRFLACLDAIEAQGRYVTDAANSQRYAPRLFVAMPEAERATTKQLKDAMAELFTSGEIKMGSRSGPDRHPQKCIVRVDPSRAGSEIP